MAKGKKRSVLYRAVRFELKVNEEQEKLLVRISDGLREIYNWALEMRIKAYEEYKRHKKENTGEKPNMPTLFDQINLLTELIREDRGQELWRANIPRNWKEETLDTLDGAFKSFFALVKNGDQDARPPWMRNEQYACEIPGRSGFSIKCDVITFAPRIFGAETLAFKAPEYCWHQFSNKKVKKFTIFRDEPNLGKTSRWWVSLVYEVDRPEPLAFSGEQAVYVSLGASWLGVISPSGEQIIKLWRPDKHWKPLIDELDEWMKRYKKGSRKWLRCKAAWRKKYLRMAREQRDNQRRVVRELLRMGVHFVVTDLVVRSKRNKLADASRPERGGLLGLNWQAQNTGSLGRLVLQLEEKAKEYGGYVIRHRLSVPPAPGRGEENKLPMARLLREDYLQQAQNA